MNILEQSCQLCQREHPAGHGQRVEVLMTPEVRSLMNKLPAYPNVGDVAFVELTRINLKV